MIDQVPDPIAARGVSKVEGKDITLILVKQRGGGLLYV